MTEKDDYNDDNVEVKIIKQTTSDTETQKTDGELIINVIIQPGMEWKWSNIDDKENNDTERETEVPGDTNNDAMEQGTTNEEIGIILEIPVQKQKGIRKALKDKIIGSLERTAKLVEKGREQQIKHINCKKLYCVHSCSIQHFNSF